MTLACNLPFHVYGFVDRRFLSGGQRNGWEPAIWFAVTLPANRSIGLTVLLQCGAQYRELPPQAWAFEPGEDAPWTVQEAQAWDCFGGAAQILEYAYLRELPVRTPHGPGFYLFTLEFAENGFSRYPAQSKSLHAIELERGRLTWQPNNALRWFESSFTDRDGDVSWLRRQTEVYGSEA